MFLIIVLALLVLLATYIKSCYKYWKEKGVVAVPHTFLIGNYKDIVFQRTTFSEKFQEIYNEYKEAGHKYVGVYFFTQPLLVLLDPELIKDILTRDFEHFVDRGLYVNEKEDPLWAHIFSLAGQKWRNLRVKFTPTFTSGKMKMMFYTLLSCGQELNKIVGKHENECIEIKDIFARYTTDVIGTCAYGIECNSLINPDSEFRIYGKKFFTPGFVPRLKILLTFFFPHIMELFNARTLNTELSDFFMATVKATVEYREKHNIKRNDFMNLLIQLKNNGKLDDEEFENVQPNNDPEGNVSLTVEQIAAQCFIFFIAGFETSSTTLSFAMYELAKNEEVQEKLRQEIREVLEKYDDEITYDGVIMNMKYMDNVVNETLRMYSPVPAINRICTKDYVNPKCNLSITKGQKVIVPLMGLHCYHKHFEKPEQFNPDRFLDYNKQLYTFLPFGDGPRNCIGQRFGLMQTKVALAVLIKNYKFTLNEKTSKTPVYDKTSLTTAMEGGVWLNVTKI